MATAVHSTRNASTTFYWIAFWLLVIGGINWGLVGFFHFDLVAAIFGQMSVGSRIIYALVGLAAIACAVMLPRRRATDTP